VERFHAYLFRDIERMRGSDFCYFIFSDNRYQIFSKNSFICSRQHHLNFSFLFYSFHAHNTFFLSSHFSPNIFFFPLPSPSLSFFYFYFFIFLFSSSRVCAWGGKYTEKIIIINILKNTQKLIHKMNQD
jgi:hypothetical protein